MIQQPLPGTAAGARPRHNEHRSQPFTQRGIAMTTKSMTCAIAALSLAAGAASTASAQMFQRAIGDQDPERHFSIANTRDGGTITVCNSVEDVQRVQATAQKSWVGYRVTSMKFLDDLLPFMRIIE